jgi:hypothetical protein
LTIRIWQPGDLKGLSPRLGPNTPRAPNSTRKGDSSEEVGADVGEAFGNELGKPVETQDIPAKRADSRETNEALVEGLGQECGEIRKEGEEHEDFVAGADSSFACESDEQQLDSSPIQGSIPANNTTDARPISISEEQAEDNIPEIYKSILATEEQSRDTVIQKDDNVESGATDSLVPVEEEHYKIDFNCTAKYRINVADSDRQEWEDLALVESFSYTSEDIRDGDAVTVIQEGNYEAVAEILEIRKPNMKNSLGNDYFVLIFWYYTRQEIQQNDCTNMKAWPLGHSYIKTTHMDVILGTSIKGKLAKKTVTAFVLERSLILSSEGLSMTLARMLRGLIVSKLLRHVLYK